MNKHTLVSVASRSLYLLLVAGMVIGLAGCDRLEAGIEPTPTAIAVVESDPVATPVELESTPVEPTPTSGGESSVPQTPVAPEPVEGWTGEIIGNAPQAQFDDFFVREGENEHYGIDSIDDSVSAQLTQARDSGRTVRVWGQLVRDVPDVNGVQIEVTRLEVQETKATPSEDGDPVEGWTGTIIKLEPGNQFGRTFQREDGEQFDIGGVDEIVTQGISQAAETGATVKLWGQVYYGVPADKARHIEVTRLEIQDGSTPEQGQAVEGWVGKIVKLEPGNQFGRYFERQDGERFDIGSESDAVMDLLGQAQESGAQIRVWGQVYYGVPADQARHIEVSRVKLLDDSTPSDDGEAVEGWKGTITKLEPGNQFGRYFQREDGQRYDISGTNDAVNARIDEAQRTGATLQVWGRVFYGVPADKARHIEAERVEIVSGPATESRNLSPLAQPSASSELPADEGGNYAAPMSIDGQVATAWVESADGSGQGEWLMLTFPTPVTVSKLGIDVGYDRTSATFAANNRVKKATAIFSNGKQIPLEFADARGVQVREIEPVETTYVQIVINEVYPGSAYDDTCLAEVQVWGTAR